MKLIDRIRLNKRICRRNWRVTLFERILCYFKLKKLLQFCDYYRIFEDYGCRISEITQSSMSTWTNILSIDALKMVKTNKCVCRYITTKDNFIIAAYILDLHSGNYICEFIHWNLKKELINHSDILYIKVLFELDIGLRNDGINELLNYYRGEK